MVLQMPLRLRGEEESSEGGGQVGRGGGGRTGGGGGREGGRTGEVSTCRNVREISGAPSQRPRPGAESTKRCRDVKDTELRRSEAKRFFISVPQRRADERSSNPTHGCSSASFCRLVNDPSVYDAGLRRASRLCYRLV